MLLVPSPRAPSGERVRGASAARVRGPFLAATSSAPSRDLRKQISALPKGRASSPEVPYRPALAIEATCMRARPSIASFGVLVDLEAISASAKRLSASREREAGHSRA